MSDVPPLPARTIAIGDVHGCLDELEELVAKVGYRPRVDRLVFVGDLVDRGPKPAAVVRYVRALSAAGDVVTILGNHEEKMLRWYRRVEEERTTGAKNKMSPPPPARLAEWDALDADDRAFVAALPVVVEPLPGWLAVHGGFDGSPRARQKPDKLLRCRYVDPVTGHMKSILANKQAPEGSVVWTTLWRGPEHVVYGHAVHSRETPRVDRRTIGDRTVECWGIDTGCCFGGRLTALCLETRETWQVDARATYADLGDVVE